MELLVKWRQVAEPNDQVLWVDLLTEREFSSGFGSHTPMFTGQTKCVRYYMNFDRALEVAKKVALRTGHVYDAHSKAVRLDASRLTALTGATTAEEYWSAVGQDSWVVVPVESTTREGHIMEGTRLTVVNLGLREREAAAAEARAEAGRGDGSHSAASWGSRTASNSTTAGVNGGGYGNDTSPGEIVPGPTLDDEGLAKHGVVQLTVDGDNKNGSSAGSAAAHATGQGQPHSFEFSIRTPVTPARWEDYDEELRGVFDNLLEALGERDRKAAATAALRFAYYWYNFMPLARGSALCGYVSILGAFLAAGMPVRSAIPISYQTDWEAILQSSPGEFIASVGGWLFPPELNGHGGVQGSETPWPCPRAEELPKVRTVLATMRERLNALNAPKGPVI